MVLRKEGQPETAKPTEGFQPIDGAREVFLGQPGPAKPTEKCQPREGAGEVSLGQAPGPVAHTNANWGRGRDAVLRRPIWGGRSPKRGAQTRRQRVTSERHRDPRRHPCQRSHPQKSGASPPV